VLREKYKWFVGVFAVGMELCKRFCRFCGYIFRGWYFEICERNNISLVIYRDLRQGFNIGMG
jgi:hypothetical protein